MNQLTIIYNNEYHNIHYIRKEGYLYIHRPIVTKGLNGKPILAINGYTISNMEGLYLVPKIERQKTLDIILKSLLPNSEIWNKRWLFEKKLTITVEEYGLIYKDILDLARSLAELDKKEDGKFIYSGKTYEEKLFQLIGTKVPLQVG